MVSPCSISASKILALQRYSVERVCCLSFNEKLARLSAEDFIKQILVDKLGVKYLVVGDDFRFGANRSGTFDLLVEAGKQLYLQGMVPATSGNFSAKLSDGQALYGCL